ncbi:hypothetical protein TNCV_4647291 [Trichonephila clavipes]|uniref:Uncharacterized protein n=1 Tax=Trichonephila clavipes TaxID=2585209 RepID=A0A8X6T1T0_TRICX|nr:hypothetical protein TNCV_4647291 [Trichonephila clavipes]
MLKKGGNRLVPGLNYMVNALKLSNQAPGVSGELLQTCVAWRCPDGTQHLICGPILAVYGQSLASNGPVVDSTYLSLVFGPTEATHNKLFLSSPTKYIVEPSWILVLVWPPFELLHRALTMIVFAQYYRMGPISHPFKKWVDFIPFTQGFADRNSIYHVFLVLIGVTPKHRASF